MHRLNLILILVLISEVTWGAMTCGKLFLDPIYSQYERSYNSDYDPKCCNTNIYRFIQRLNQLGERDFLKNSQVLFLFSRSHNWLFPERNRNHGQVSKFTAHVVLDTPRGIFDLDESILDGPFVPKSRAAYFKNMFFREEFAEPLFSNLMVSRIPALEYLNELKMDHGDKVITIESDMTKWIKTNLEYTYEKEFHGLFRKRRVMRKVKYFL
ncbi:MAG: hypothetical protein R2827_12880 [Bdellovibrionales bacterium]